MDFDSLSKSDLVDYCRKNGIKKYSGKTKAQIIELIKTTAPVDPPQLITGGNPLPIGKYEKEEPYLANYLKSITAKDGGFKRVLSSPLRYPGGKTKAVGIILNLLPKLRHKKVVSPFFGGGSVELCLSQTLGIEVKGYDIFSFLTNFWNVLIHHRDEFIGHLESFQITEEEFTRNRHILLHYWDKVKPATLVYHTKKMVDLTDHEKTMLDDSSIMQAVYYYYNMSLSYGPMFLGWPSKHEINRDKFKRRIESLKTLDLKNLSVECCDFETAIISHPDDFLYLDPPYYLGGDSKMFKGMYPNCNFAIHHNEFPHDKLCRLLKQHRGGFILTYNDCPTIRQMYSDYRQEFPSWQYTYGQGETRIGKNREKGDHVKESHEIIIICPPLV